MLTTQTIGSGDKVQLAQLTKDYNDLLESTWEEDRQAEEQINSGIFPCLRLLALKKKNLLELDAQRTAMINPDLSLVQQQNIPVAMPKKTIQPPLPDSYLLARDGKLCRYIRLTSGGGTKELKTDSLRENRMKVEFTNVIKKDHAVRFETETEVIYISKAVLKLYPELKPTNTI